MPTTQRPPTIDPRASARWFGSARPGGVSWLHDEIGQRMDERLQWITRQPDHWADWYPSCGGFEAHRRVARRFGHARSTVVEPTTTLAARAEAALQQSWWRPGRWRGGGTRVLAEPAQPEPGSMGMVWSNMALHFAADPESLISQWHRALSPEGYLMFSCLGPDTLVELRALYAEHGWAPAGPAFTDMHDWGDMLVHAGFADPVMDMERVVVRYQDPQRMVRELREAGRNLHPQRFAGMRGRGYATRLEAALSGWAAREADGHISLTVEVVYGHAFKPRPRVRVAAESAVSVEDMRSMLRGGRGPAVGR